jgi:hypothetical protein
LTFVTAFPDIQIIDQQELKRVEMLNSSKCYLPNTPKNTSSERFACFYNASHLLHPKSIQEKSNKS